MNLGCAWPPQLRDVGQLHQPDHRADGAHANAETYGDNLVSNPSGKKPEVITLPKHLDEKVARLHLDKFGVKLTELSTDQADYIGVQVEDYKPEHYY